MLTNQSRFTSLSNNGFIEFHAKQSHLAILRHSFFEDRGEIHPASLPSLLGICRPVEKDVGYVCETQSKTEEARLLSAY